jgi:hypothetical protein
MSNQDHWFSVMSDANSASPIDNPYSYYASGSDNSDPGIFVCFKDIDALADGLMWGEPAVYDFLDDEATVHAYHEQIGPAIAELKDSGICEASILELTNSARGVLNIRWLGTFDQLRNSQGEFPQEVIANFRDQDESDSTSPIEARS